MWLLAIILLFQFSPPVLAATPVDLELLFEGLRMEDDSANKTVHAYCEKKSEPCFWKENNDKDELWKEPCED